MKYSELKKDLNSKKFLPLYLFHGEEEFLKREVVEQITNALVPPNLRTFNYSVQYGKEATPDSILDFADMPPINSQWRLLIVKDAQNLRKDYRNKLISYLKNPNPTTCIIFWASERIDERQKFYSAFKERGCIVNFWQLFDNQIDDWIISKFRSLGKNIQIKAVRLLHDSLGSNLQTISNEIQKLLIFVGDKKNITEEDVAQLIGFSKEENVFELADLIGKRNVAGALQILDRLILNGVHGVYIIAMLTRHFSLLWRAKSISKKWLNDKELSKKLHQSPRNAKKYLQQSKNFTPVAIVNCFEYLYSADLELKSTSTEQKIIMERLVYNLCR